MIDDIHKYTQINSFASEKLTPIEGPIPDSPESPDPETADVRFADGSIIYRSKSLLDLLAETQKSQTIVVYENDTSADSGVDAEFELPASVSKVLLQKEGEGKKFVMRHRMLFEPACLLSLSDSKVILCDLQDLPLRCAAMRFVFEKQ